MAESKNNIITHGLSGKVGDLLVFSQRNGKTIVSKIPKERTGESTDKQKAHQLKFQKAVLYAKSVMADPIKKEQYEEQADTVLGKSIFNIAVADLMNAPDIEALDFSGYNGNPGDLIKITVTDDFEVVLVTVKIENSDGGLVEEGAAVKNGMEWIYTATVLNIDLNGDKITVIASDNPANMTEKTQTL